MQLRDLCNNCTSILSEFARPALPPRAHQAPAEPFPDSRCHLSTTSDTFIPLFDATGQRQTPLPAATCGRSNSSGNVNCALSDSRKIFHRKAIHRPSRIRPSRAGRFRISTLIEIQARCDRKGRRRRGGGRATTDCRGVYFNKVRKRCAESCIET